MSRKKKNSVSDPFAEREAAKYSDPIPSREYIMQYLNELKQPVSVSRIAKALDLQSEMQLEALRRRLRAMERDGQLLCNRRGNYGVVDRMELLRGRVVAFSDEHGVVEVESTQQTIVLRHSQLRTVLDGDRVLVRIAGTDARGRPEGIIVEILERGIQTVVGHLVEEGSILFLVPNNKKINRDILIPPDATGGAKAGQVVVAELLLPSSVVERRQPLGRVIEVVGDHMAPGMEIDIAMRTHNLPHVWPQDVLTQIQKFPAEVKLSDDVVRKDLRELPFVTIDGDDARDFDDAVYCARESRGSIRLYVAIADVSYYVQPETPLDSEALCRGNSVYFPSRVIPMLPEVLSNELCSLKPEVDRLVLVCEVSINQRGDINDYLFYRAVIHSKARLTYEKVAAFLTEGAATIPSALHPPIHDLYVLFKKLIKVREQRGGIEFDFPETKILFDEKSKIKQIIPYERNDAHRVIEECMLVANVCAADFLRNHKIPTLYRVHEGPRSEKLTDVRAFLYELGYKLGGGDKPKPSDYVRILEKIKGRPDHKLIETVLLRSMAQAQYNSEVAPHFGLAYPAYTHFTSPIRRYPDLLVHRGIIAILEHQQQKFPYDNEKMHMLGQHCSMTERRADDATRDTVQWLKCEFMQEKLGKQFSGKITGVTHFGIFVELLDHFVEGLVHITALPSDYYHFDAGHYLLRGERSGATFQLGDRVEVSVSRVDLEQKQIDFELVVANSKTSQARKRKTSRTVKRKRA